MSHTWVLGRSLCTTLSAPDLHNAALLTAQRVLTIHLYHLTVKCELHIHIKANIFMVALG